jgi:hypothetical protein
MIYIRVTRGRKAGRRVNNEKKVNVELSDPVIVFASRT